MPRLRIIGRGRAGGSLAGAVSGTRWDVVELRGRGHSVTDAASGVDLVVIATPDDVIADISRSIEPESHTVIAHMAGSLGLGVLAGHERQAAIHPLVALPDPQHGAIRLRDSAWFATAGDPLASELVADLGGREFAVADEDRALYHCAAVIASNHLVAVLGQAERIGRLANVPFEALMDLVMATVRNVDELGPVAALTGPAARGDDATIERHVAALPDHERPCYEAMVGEARRLAAQARAATDAGSGSGETL